MQQSKEAAVKHERWQGGFVVGRGRPTLAPRLLSDCGFCDSPDAIAESNVDSATRLLPLAQCTSPKLQRARSRVVAAQPFASG